MTYEEPVDYGTIRHQRQGSLDNRVPVPGLGGYLIGAANDVFVNEPSEEIDDEAGLPPADHGKQAWLFLIGCFWLEGLLWGKRFPLSREMIGMERRKKITLQFDV